MTLLNTQTCKRGEPIHKMWTAAEAYLVKNFLNTFRVTTWNRVYTEIDRSDPDGSWVIRIPRGGQRRFNGEAYAPDGRLYENLNDESKPWLKYNLSSGEITEETGPPARPWGSNESWRKKIDIAGAAYF